MKLSREIVSSELEIYILLKRTLKKILHSYGPRTNKLLFLWRLSRRPLATLHRVKGTEKGLPYSVELSFRLFALCPPGGCLLFATRDVAFASPRFHHNASRRSVTALISLHRLPLAGDSLFAALRTVILFAARYEGGDYAREVFA